MKLTKTRLKEIIKEEVEKVALKEVDLAKVFQQRQAQKAGAPAEKEAPDATKIQDVATVLKYINKINTPQEYSNLLDKVISHAAKVKGSTIILRKLHKALPSVMKEEELKAVLIEADDYINPTGMGGSSRWEKTGRMRPHYTSHGADYERFKPTYKMTDEHPDHPDYKKPPSKDARMRANCRKHAGRAVYKYDHMGNFDKKSGDPANEEAVYTRCMQLKAFTPGRKKDTEYLDDYFKDESWYRDDDVRRNDYYELYYKFKDKPWHRAYIQEGKMKITKSRLKEIIKEEVTKILEAGRPHSLRGGRTMKDLDDEAKMRETDPLKKKKKEVSGVKVVEEEEELDETSAMGTGAVAGYSGTTTEEEKKKKLSHS